MQDLRALGKRVAGVMPGPECSGSERAGGAVGSPRAATLAMAAIVLLLTSQLGGCATKVAARSRPPTLGPAGNTWELVFESPKPVAEDAMKLIVQRMESAMELDVPLVVEASASGNWFEGK